MFKRGETAVIKLLSKNSAGTLTDPATSIKVTITNPAGTAMVTDTAMTKDSTGTYHYNYTIASDAVLGWYRARVTTDDASLVSKQDVDFVVEA